MIRDVVGKAAMLKQAKDDKTRLSILGEALEGMKGTVFRQAQFVNEGLAPFAAAYPSLGALNVQT